MKTLFVALLLSVFATTVNAGDLAKMTKEEKCEAWTSFAMYGASQQTRGAKREVQYLSTAGVMEMVEHGLGKDRLYLFKDDENTPEELAFLASGALSGYDKMVMWRATHTELPVHSEWVQEFIYECMSKP